jgi:transposase
VDPNGGLLGEEEFEVSAAGYEKLLRWLTWFGAVTRVGVEGTGSYGAELTRFLAGAGIEVVEVDRPDRQARHRQGKSDSVDAVTAAQSALSGKAKGKPKGRNGNVEALRVLNVARRSARNHRIATLCQIRHLAFCAPDELRVQLIAMVRARSDVRTQAYVERRLAEGRTKGEIYRCLKRYIAREVFKYLPRDLRA